jgi:DNA invertase Pin-like site-specific DNA recombinase
MGRLKAPEAPARHVAYYRVSTQKQGHSGLGLEAQRHAVAQYLGNKPLLAEYTEIESGKRHKNRPQLQAALQRCQKTRAKLVIAKLDRLARNVHFISSLQESKVDFVAADMPYADRTTIQIMAVMAEQEGRMISQRTKDALAAVKARGTKLGNPRWQESLAKARAARNYTKPEPEVVRMIASMNKRKFSLRAIARELNRLNIRTPLGCQWYAASVSSYVAP